MAQQERYLPTELCNIIFLIKRTRKVNLLIKSHRDPCKDISLENILDKHKCFDVWLPRATPRSVLSRVFVEYYIDHLDSFQS